MDCLIFKHSKTKTRKVANMPPLFKRTPDTVSSFSPAEVLGIVESIFAYRQAKASKRLAESNLIVSEHRSRVGYNERLEADKAKFEQANDLLQKAGVAIHKAVTEPNQAGPASQPEITPVDLAAKIEELVSQ